jgi:hypothetical protein
MKNLILIINLNIGEVAQMKGGLIVGQAMGFGDVFCVKQSMLNFEN